MRKLIQQFKEVDPWRLFVILTLIGSLILYFSFKNRDIVEPLKVSHSDKVFVSKDCGKSWNLMNSPTTPFTPPSSVTYNIAYSRHFNIGQCGTAVTIQPSEFTFITQESKLGTLKFTFYDGLEANIKTVIKAKVRDNNRFNKTIFALDDELLTHSPLTIKYANKSLQLNQVIAMEISQIKEELVQDSKYVDMNESKLDKGIIEDEDIQNKFEKLGLQLISVDSIITLTKNSRDLLLVKYRSNSNQE